MDTRINLGAFQIATYHAMGTEFGGVPRHYRVLHRYGWSFPASLCKTARAEIDAETIKQLREANVVWPLVLDTDLRHLLTRHILQAVCRAVITRFFLIPDRSGASGFRCIAK